MVRWPATFRRSATVRNVWREPFVLPSSRKISRPILRSSKSIQSRNSMATNGRKCLCRALSRKLFSGMPEMEITTHSLDVMDQILGARPGDALHQLRHARDKVVHATQAFHELAFHAAGLTSKQRQDRFLVAALLAQATGPQALSEMYRSQLIELQPSQDHIDVLEGRQSSSAALNVLADFTRALAIHPSTANRDALLGLVAAGWSVPDIVSLAQVIGYVSYQTRSIIGLQALRDAADIASSAVASEPVEAETFVHPAHLP